MYLFVLLVVMRKGLPYASLISISLGLFMYIFLCVSIGSDGEVVTLLLSSSIDLAISLYRYLFMCAKLNVLWK